MTNLYIEDGSYLVREDEGFVSVCVVLDGLFEREVSVLLFIEDGNAIGKKVI